MGEVVEVTAFFAIMQEKTEKAHFLCAFSFPTGGDG